MGGECLREGDCFELDGWEGCTLEIEMFWADKGVGNR